MRSLTLIEAEFTSPEIREPIAYAVLRPSGNDDRALPLLYVLHGANGSRDFLARVGPSLEQAWAQGALPPFVAVTPTIPARSIYANFLDGSERWEDALVGSFLRHVRDAHGASSERRLTMTYGPAMGGTASLRLAFKHPDVFGAVAAIAPGIAPALDFADIELRDRFWQPPEPFARTFGSPVDAAYWRANNPASIAHDQAAKLRDAGLAIYLECGDEDSLGAHRGAEHLHRVLFDNGIPHEYRLVRGADHVGATMPARFGDAMAFLAKVIAPPPPDPTLGPFRDRVAAMKRAAGL